MCCSWWLDLHNNNKKEMPQQVIMYETLQKQLQRTLEKRADKKSKPCTEAVKITVNKHNSMTRKQETKREQNALS